MPSKYPAGFVPDDEEVTAYPAGFEPDTPTAAPPTWGQTLTEAGARTVRMLPGALGAVRGAAMGAPFGPLGAAAGGVLGYVTGESIPRAVEGAVDYLRGRSAPVQPVQDVTEAARFTGEKVLEALQGEAVGRGLGGLARGVAGAYRGLRGLGQTAVGAGAPSVSTSAATAAAERQGITLPAAARAGSSAVDLLESVPQAFPVGRATGAPLRGRVRESTQQAVQRATAPAGAPLEPEVAGRQVQEALEGVGTTRRAAAGTDFDTLIAEVGQPLRGGRVVQGKAIQQGLQAERKLRGTQTSKTYEEALTEMGGTDTPVSMGNLAKVAGGQAGRAERVILPGEPAASMARKVASATGQSGGGTGDDVLDTLLAKGDPQVAEFLKTRDANASDVRTLGEAVQLWQKLRQESFKLRGSPEGRRVSQMADALEADIAAASPAGIEPLQAAGVQYASQVGQSYGRGTPVRAAMRQLERPGRVADSILKASDPDLVANVVRALPDRDRGNVAASVLQRLRETYPDDPAKLGTAVLKIGDDNLRTLYGAKAAKVTETARKLVYDFSKADPFESRLIGKTQPSAVVDTMVKADPGEFDRVWGTLPPNAQSGIRRALVHRLLKGSTNADTGAFDLHAFVRAKEAVDEKKWSTVMGTDGAAALADIEAAVRQVNQYSKRFMNEQGGGILGPGQVTSMAGAATAGALLGVSPAGIVTGIATLLSPYGIGKAIFSESGQRFLSGLPGRQRMSGKKIEELGRLMGRAWVGAGEVRAPQR